MRPHDVVQPTKLCMEVIHKFRSHHRGIVLAFPDQRFKCKAVNVKWNHRRKPLLMAIQYVEKVKEEQ